jgi:hypothetical protein
VDIRANAVLYFIRERKADGLAIDFPFCTHEDKRQERQAKTRIDRPKRLHTAASFVSCQRKNPTTGLYDRREQQQQQEKGKKKIDHIILPGLSEFNNFFFLFFFFLLDGLQI